MIDMKEKKVCTMTHPSLSKADMEQAHSDREEILSFVGGAEKPISFLDENVPFDLGVDENDNPVIKTWREYAYYRESLDGQNVLINAAFPVAYKDGRCVSCSNSKKDGFLEFADALGIDNMLTKSEYETLIKSNAYTEAP